MKLDISPQSATQRNIISILLFFIFIIIHNCPPSIETVPFMNRTRIIWASQEKENTFGKIQFEDWKKSHNVVPVTNPDTKRVELIFHKIVNVARREVKQSKTLDLDKLNWEMSLIDDNDGKYGGLCFGGGRIVINANSVWGRTDDTIATIVGHEVAHAIARHIAEDITNRFLVDCIVFFGMGWRRLALYMFATNMSDVLDIHVWFPLSRMTELEAGHIGLMLMSSAGYDPRAALSFYGGHSDEETTHPSGKRSAEYLNQPDIMGRALALYNKKNSLST